MLLLFSHKDKGVNMLSKSIAIEVLNAALSTGGDYAEIYVEQTHSQSYTLDNGRVEGTSQSLSYGAGIRILNGLKSVYGYTSDLSKKSLVALAGRLAAAYTGKPRFVVQSIETQKVKKINPVNDHLLEVPAEEKIALLKEASGIIKGVNESKIVRVSTNFSNYLKEIEIWNAEGETGKLFRNTEERGRLFFVGVASDGEKIESAFKGPGRFGGWHYFKDELDWRALAKKTGETAVALLSASECPSGRYPVVIANGWGGVIFHEACGHSLEATATAKGLSVFSNSIGKQIANPIVSAFDDGTIPNEWGSNNIDSEGNPTHNNQLIKDGICVGFLVDKFNGRRLKMEANGVSRRQSYRYEPTSRMSNTYIAAGKDDPEAIIRDTPLGIYVTDFGGGSVNPTTGEFNFSASEAYVIRNGKVCEMVKGCTLIGSGKEVLMNIDRVGNDLALGQGMCGSLSGMIPVDVGQPTIRIKEITVGGRGGELK